MKKIIIISFTLAFLSSPLYSQWEKLYFPGYTPYTILNTPQGLFAANVQNIYISKDNGISWDSLSSISSISISKILQIDNILLLNTSRLIIWPKLIPSVFRSDDFGKNWYPVLDAVFGGESIAFCNSRTYVDLDGQIYCSIDTGRTWNLLDAETILPYHVAEVISDGNSLYARIQSEALFRSDDNGFTWDSLNTYFSNHFYTILAKDSCIYLGTYSDGFYISKDRGDSWQNASAGLTDSAGIHALHLVSNNIISSISKDFQQSIYRYSLKENKWHPFNEGFLIKRLDWIFDFENNSEYLFLASDNSIWRGPVTDLITDVYHINNQVINDAILFQNYPNPFNPVTTIKFSIPNSDLVKIQIINTLGEVVAVVYDEVLNPGTYKIKFDGSNFPSGLYFYRLETSKFSKTKKFLLIK
jgi:photosystem II stability/assembly factor-like uncharacterized protein